MSKLESIKKYRDHHGINYSLIKQVILNQTKSFTGNKYSDRGSLLDSMITLSKEELDELYVVYDEKRYEGKLAEIMKKAFERYSYYNPITKPYSHYRGKLIEAAKLAEFGGKGKTEEKLGEALDNIQKYWELLTLKQTKEVISKSEYEEAEKLVYKLKNELPGKLIFDENPIYQVDIYGQVKVRDQMVDVKGLIDILIIQPDQILLIDLKKTDFSLDTWHDVALKNMYHMQLSLYKDILSTMYPNKPIKCFWLCVSNWDIRVFEVHEADLRIGRDSGRTVKQFTYDATDEKLVKEIYNYGYIDGIAKLLDARTLGIQGYNIEKYNNNGIYPPKSIFE